MGKISNEEYLKQKIASAKLYLEDAYVKHRIVIAEYEVRTSIIKEQIVSMQNQLEGEK